MIGNIKNHNTLGITYLTSPNAQNGKRMRSVYPSSTSKQFSLAVF